MSSYKVVIDLGSSYISAGFLGSSFIVKEPSIVALDSSLQEVKAVGSSAVKMFSESYSKVKIARPILEGCIIDFDNGRTLVKYIIKKLLPHIRNFSKISVTCIVPCATTSNDKKKIETALLTLGLRQVAFIEAVLCSSYALFSESNVNKGIVADIGSDCADFAAVYNGNIIAGCTLYYAGKQLTEAILGLVKSKYGIVLDFEEAEKLKLACASLYYNDTSTCVVSGISITSGLTEEVELSAKELYNTVTDFCRKYFQVIESLILSVPDEASNLIKQSGVFLCGGGARLTGLDSFIADNTKLEVMIGRDPQNSAINGAILG